MTNDLKTAIAKHRAHNQKALDAFKAEFEACPATAFHGADGAMVAAAMVATLNAVEADLEAFTPEHICKALQTRVNRAALFPPTGYSTSGNMMAVYDARAAARTLELMREEMGLSQL